MSKSFLVKSTPQIIEIINSVFEIKQVSDRSKLMHQILLPYLLDVIVSDNTEIDDTDRASREITRIFDSYIESI